MFYGCPAGLQVELYLLILALAAAVRVFVHSSVATGQLQGFRHGRLCRKSVGIILNTIGP